MIDMSSFGKIEVEGPGALALLDRVTRQPRRPRAGQRRLHPVSQHARRDRRRRHRHAPRRRPLPGGDRAPGTVDSDLGWLRAHMRARRRRGLAARRERRAGGDRDLGAARARHRRGASRRRRLGRGAASSAGRSRSRSAARPVLAQRITYVGELGFELYVPPEWAVQVWDRLRAAGAAHGLEVGGYRTLESLRMEKGYRYMGTDLTRGRHAVRGRRRLLRGGWQGRVRGPRGAREPRASPQRLLRTHPARRRRVPRRLRRRGRPHRPTAWWAGCAAAPTGSRSGATSPTRYLPADARRRVDEVMVEVFGGLVPAEVAETVLYDPENARIRG